jgi:hypothetical protein
MYSLYTLMLIIIQIKVEKSIELYKLLICCNLFVIFEATMLSNLAFEWNDNFFTAYQNIKKSIITRRKRKM